MGTQQRIQTFLSTKVTKDISSPLWCDCANLNGDWVVGSLVVFDTVSITAQPSKLFSATSQIAACQTQPQIFMDVTLVAMSKCWWRDSYIDILREDGINWKHWTTVLTMCTQILLITLFKGLSMCTSCNFFWPSLDFRLFFCRKGSQDWINNNGNLERLCEKVCGGCVWESKPIGEFQCLL